MKKNKPRIFLWCVLFFVSGNCISPPLKKARNKNKDCVKRIPPAIKKRKKRLEKARKRKKTCETMLQDLTDTRSDTREAINIYFLNQQYFSYKSLLEDTNQEISKLSNSLEH